MGDRGRKPAGELSVVTELPEAQRRPKAPADFNAEQKKVWRKTVEALPVDWFRQEVQDTLEQYCRHIVQGRIVARMVAEMEMRPQATDGNDPVEGVHFNLKQYGELLKLHKGESAQANALARSMRITLQASYEAKKKKPEQGKKAWEA